MVASLPFDPSSLVIDDTNDGFDIFVHDQETAKTERVSVASDGSQAEEETSAFVRVYSEAPSISVDGQFVAFHSNATNLVADDSNGEYDIFVHDRQTGTTERMSLASDGAQADESSFSPALSADSHYVAFRSLASNLVTNDSNGTTDIFVHDRQTGTTERVSVASDGSQGDGHSYSPTLSADGRYLAFESDATNLVADDTNGTFDVFFHDRDTGTTERVSVASDSTQGNGSSRDSALSADGNHVAFRSNATNLVADDTNDALDVFVHERQFNNLPTADAGTDQIADEGDTVTLDGSGSLDPDNDELTYLWALVDSTGPAITLSDVSTVQPTVTTMDNGSYTFQLTANDGQGGTDTDEVVITIDNVVPTVDEIIAPADPVAVNTEITVSADFTDPGVLDTHTAIWDWGDGSQCDTAVDPDCNLTETDGSGTVAGSHTYSEPGVYTLSLTVTDKDGGSDSAAYQYVVVYDPDGGSVRGNGTIESPAGACQLTEECMTLAGLARFGFTSRYKPGTNEVTGKTQFRFQAGSLHFQSDVYDWLVVSGARAQFKGIGSIKGLDGSYRFMLTAIDGDINGGGGADKFRIKIWSINEDGSDGDVIYDNQVDDDSSDSADPTTVITSGQITIQKK
jgi:Tol biopolymer transport system component/PKD repeat protein